MSGTFDKGNPSEDVPQPVEAVTTAPATRPGQELWPRLLLLIGVILTMAWASVLGWGIWLAASRAFVGGE